MLELLWISSSSFLAALSGAVVPGPVFALVLSSSLRSGKVSGPLIVLGHLLIEGIVILMIFLGFQQLLQSSEVRSVIGYVGGAMLIFMGLKMILDAVKMRTDSPILNDVDGVAKSDKILPYRLIFSGFLASGSNPHFFLWWLTTGLPLMANSIFIAGPLGFILFLVGHAAADLLWFSFVSFSVHEGKRFLNEKALKIILISSSLFLIFFAIYIIFSASYAFNA